MLRIKFYFSTWILPDYVTYESHKEFWKHRHFENTRTGFLQRCQNWLQQNRQKMRHKKERFNKYYDVAFDPNKIYTHWTPQNDRLNLRFVKDTYIVAKKWPEMVKNGYFWKFFFSYKIEKHSWWKDLS